ncbi:MAG TPA: LytR C-terminal domain-containing protein [Mycobacteriales bacterium]|nr:LytR C-terminal domain-containing protein [Mycobacteriales bacterium]
MTDPPEQPSARPPGERPVSHRGAFEPTPLVARLVAPTTAIVVVVVVVILLIIINGHGSGGPSSAAVVVGTPPPASQVAVPAPSPSRSHERSNRPRPSPSSPSPSSNARRSPKTSTPAHDAWRHAVAPVQVLNNSRITGLAHEVAAQVADRGWQVVYVGNLQGRTPTSTVFYPPGKRAAARHLASQFSSIDRIEPNSEGGITSAGLTLVVTRYWAL